MVDERKVSCVAECWIVTRHIEQWSEIIRYGDVGFPLAWAHSEDMCKLTKRGEQFVDELYQIIVETLGLDPDKEYKDFEEMLDDNIAKQEEEKTED